MLNLLKKNGLIIACILCTLLFTNCNNENPSVIGLGIVDDDIFDPKYTDTISLNAHSFIYNSINSGNISDNNGNMLGAIYDATFGKTTSRLATAFHMSTGSQSLKFNPVADSVEISFAYNSYYGDENYTHTLRVYELQEILEADSSYLSTYRVNHSNIELASITFTPSFDTITVNEEEIPPRFTFKLNNSFGNRILSAFPNDTTITNEMLIKEFNGFYIAPDPVNTPNSGSFLRLDFDNAYTYINIYYHNDTADNLVFKLVTDDDTPRFLEYEHYDYQHASTAFRAQVLDNNTSLGEQTLYVQSFGGIATKISMPYFSNFSSVNNIAIANATITFHVDVNDVEFGVPANYELVRMNDNDQMVTIADYAEGSTFYMGTLDSEKGTITFRITRHLQNYLLGNINSSDLYLHVRNSGYSPGRCVLFGPNSSDPAKNIKMEITYTSIE
ncbi:MAG: DUF4270 domain-containing protein [Bacteroidales bacterium]|jgi:hypothetical protein|nr:DUF4270 domain-containing protein [Bacteroidales bacterium]